MSTSNSPLIPSCAQGQQASPSATGGVRKKRRGPRAAVACDSCRTRRVKCDGACPCSSCVYHGFECSYKGRPQHKPADRPQSPVSQVTSHSRPLAAKRRRSLLGTESHQPPQQALNPALQTPISLNALAQNHSVSGASLLAEPSDRPEKITHEGLTETNHHTEGSEFYGATGTFYFLSTVRSHANSQSSPASTQNERESLQDKATPRNSVVNLLHSSDYPAHHDSQRLRPHAISPKHTRDVLPEPQGSNEAIASVCSGSMKARDIEIERECVRLYFQNLHCIHPILEQAVFVKRCEKEVWAPFLQDCAAAPSQAKINTRFLALFNVVLALGAITAGETSMLLWEHSIKFVDEAERLDDPQRVGIVEMTKVYPPIRTARLFFERCKFHQEDIFESTSFETAQTLLLMAIFCQNALKPHSCYMYSGMALRTALAIGIPTRGKAHSQSERLFWWALYSHDIEMCCSAGRLSFLREATFYPISHPSSPTSSAPLTYLVNCMIDLAQIFAKIAAESHMLDDRLAFNESYERSAAIERELLDWRSMIPTELDFDLASLQESELMTKQKVVLKLRFLNAQIFLKRRFLISGTTEPRSKRSSDQIMSCVQAARETIRFVHDTYLHRPYFRTWWYNCTYVLDASMVLLYAIICNIYPSSTESLFADVEKSLEIYDAMKILAVARRCAEITRDVLDVAKRSYHGRLEQPRTSDQPTSLPSTVLEEISAFGEQHSAYLFNDRNTGDLDLSQQDLYSSLIDSNLAFKFLNFEDWNAWSAEAFQDKM